MNFGVIPSILILRENVKIDLPINLNKLSWPAANF